MSDAITDEQLIARVLSGDTNAYSVIFDRYQRYVGSIVIKHVPESSVDEIVAGVFLSAYRSLRKYRGEGIFRSWLATIARRRCCDYWRKARATREVSMSTLGDEQRRWIESAVSDASASEYDAKESQHHARQVVLAALEGLEPETRLLIVMLDLEGRSVKEAAEALGWGMAKTKMRAYYGRSELRERLRNLL